MKGNCNLELKKKEKQDKWMMRYEALRGENSISISISATEHHPAAAAAARK